jgi:cytochrome c oxidase subunit 4
MATKAPFETHHHIVPIIVYVKVISALIVLMVITVIVGQIELPSVGPISGTVLNQSFALLIAVIKATLVVLFFMGVRWSTTLTKLWAMLGFVWLSFFTIMWGDYGTRNIEQVQGWESHSSALPRTNMDHIGQPDPNDINIRPRG